MRKFFSSWFLPAVIALCSLSVLQAQTLQSTASSTSVVLPLEAQGGYLFATVQDPLLGTLHLLVDTGAERTLLSARLVEPSKINHHFTDRFYSFYGFGSGNQAKLLGHVELELHSVATAAGQPAPTSGQPTLGQMDAFILSADRLNIGSKQVDGILGWDFFQNRCIQIDVRAGRMVVSYPANAAQQGSSACKPQQDGFYSPTVEWMKQGLLMPLAITLEGGRTFNLNLHVDSGSDNVVLSPRWRILLGSGKSQTASKHTGAGVNGSYQWDLATAIRIEADGGHPKMEGAIPLVIMRKQGYAHLHWYSAGTAEVKMFRDGVVGNSLLGNYELVFDGREHKLYERAYSFAAPAP